MATDFKTVSDMLLHRVASTPSQEAYSYPDGSGWKRVTWKDFGDQVKDVAMGLRALGLQNEQRVGLVCSTRYEWIVADMAINCAAGATTTVYPSSTEEDGVYILNDSNSALVFAENADQVKKLVNRKAELKSVKQVIVIDGPGGHDGWVMSWADLVAKGRASSWADFETVARSAKSSDLATLIYTSGTTGKPKGVELTHDCWVYEAQALDELKLLNIEDVQYLWLPLAHSFGKLLEVVQIRIGFATAVDGRVDKIVENLGVVKPTFVAAVPRIFEKVYNKVVGGAKEGGGLKYSIFKWAIGVGKEVSKLKQARQPVTGMLAMKNSLADKLVFSKLKGRFGGRVRYFISGSAPLSREIAEFFHACDILILEGYGLTETSAFSFVNRPDNFEFGSVGQPAPGTELKIEPESGEILIKGRGVMRGYHGLAEASAESLKNGWLHTGDKGEMTALGNLKITDRIKDLIKTSGGKYVAPQTIEGKFKSSCPYVSQVLVHGNNRNFCTALVALDPVEITNWARANQLAGNYAEIVKDPRVHALIKPFFDELNKSLANYESIKRFAILPQDLTLEAGDLTPSLKLKRKAVEGKYKDLLDGFYAGGIAEV
jgi:long-chain acyl-CoA synthetase